MNLFPKFPKARSLANMYFNFYLLAPFFPQLNYQEEVSHVAGSCRDQCHLGLVIAKHVTPPCNSLWRHKFKADLLRCINRAPRGSFEQDSRSAAAVWLPGHSVCFADRGQNVSSLEGKSQAGFWQRSSQRSQVLRYKRFRS